MQLLDIIKDEIGAAGVHDRAKFGPAWIVHFTRVFWDLTRVNGGRSRSAVDGGESYDLLVVRVHTRGLVRRSLMVTRGARARAV